MANVSNGNAITAGSRLSKSAAENLLGAAPNMRAKPHGPFIDVAPPQPHSDGRNVGIKAENGFKVARAICIKPIHYCAIGSKDMLPSPTCQIMRLTSDLVVV